MTEASIFTFIKSAILNILHKASEGNFFMFMYYVLYGTLFLQTTWCTHSCKRLICSWSGNSVVY